MPTKLNCITFQVMSYYKARKERLQEEGRALTQSTQSEREGCRTEPSVSIVGRLDIIRDKQISLTAVLICRPAF